MATMSVRDSMFLLAESREQPTHVGSLMLFERPEGAGPDFLGDLHRRLVADDDVAPIFRRRAERSLGSLGQWEWADDDELDMEYHVRLSALPRPGRIRELLELVSRLHGTLLDRNRPLWEFHLIEGVEGDRFAVYSKTHHALMDGVTGIGHLRKSLSADPDERDMLPFWKVDPRGPRTPRTAPGVLDRVRSAVGTAGQALAVGPALASSLYRGLTEPDVALPFSAPHTMLNGPITGARRFAAQSWPLKRIQRVRERTGSTVNDVVLAMSAGALRRYLIEHDALPESPLTAALPVALPTGGSGSGNSLGAILVSLATEEPDAGTRLERIKASGTAAKDNLASRDPMSVAALSLAVAAPLPIGATPGLGEMVNPGFNLIISNVPGPTEPLYWDGARLDGLYPLSVPMNGQGLNITVVSYADNMEFGLTGDRRRVPRLQRLLVHLEDALAELEDVADATGKA